MQIAREDVTRVCSESDVYDNVLDLDHKYIVELGCGTAVHTRAIAAGGRGRHVTAFEVDRIQHEKNLSADAPGNIEFRYGGAEAIGCTDGSVDVVMMFKSLHHVPGPALDRALDEIARVLKPGGHAYISEPVFAGEFNDIIRLFHDEQAVRRDAFTAISSAIGRGPLTLAEQIFFLSPVEFTDFAEFEQRIINVTHTDMALDESTHARTRTLFERHMGPGGAKFLAPMRVDLLRKTA